MAHVNSENQASEQEITALRLQLERSERQMKVNTSRMNAEIISLRMRLDRADSDLLHSQRENFQLVDQVASLEKKVMCMKSTVPIVIVNTIFSLKLSKTDLNETNRTEKDMDHKNGIYIFPRMYSK